MDSNYVTAFVGLAGAAVGGVASFATTWLTHLSSIRDRHLESEHAKLEALFGDFISEAARLYGDALTHSEREVADLVRLYALLGRMRLVADRQVVLAGEMVLASILEAYRAPNRTLQELEMLAHDGKMNFLIDFGESCRRQLNGNRLTK